MDEKNNSLSFLDLLEHMKSYLGSAGKVGRDVDERLKALVTPLGESDTPRDDEGET
jgi:hypothetical protein